MSNSISNVYSAEEKRMDGALRLFEALSGVDEELLAKCEAKPIGKANRQYLNKQKIFSFMHGGGCFGGCGLRFGSRCICMANEWSHVYIKKSCK